MSIRPGCRASAPVATDDKTDAFWNCGPLRRIHHGESTIRSDLRCPPTSVTFKTPPRQQYRNDKLRGRAAAGQPWHVATSRRLVPQSEVAHLPTATGSKGWIPALDPPPIVLQSQNRARPKMIMYICADTLIMAPTPQCARSLITRLCAGTRVTRSGLPLGLPVRAYMSPFGPSQNKSSA
jgi:hypothetical protein